VVLEFVLRTLSKLRKEKTNGNAQARALIGADFAGKIQIQQTMQGVCSTIKIILVIPFTAPM